MQICLIEMETDDGERNGMHAEIVMIGTELLLGELVDTNANRLARALRNIGMDLLYKTTVGDNEKRITEVLNLALDRSDVVITSGGIGPTVDDMTRQAVAEATGRKLVHSLELEAQIEARFRSFGRKMADNNKRQAYIPEGARPLPNPVGTAPCFLSEDTKGRGFIISLPGVPRELEFMMEHRVLPLLVERMGGAQVTKVRILRTCALGESNVDRAIGDLMTLGNPTVGLAAHAGQTDVRITAKAGTQREADALIASVEAQVRERLGVGIYGENQETLPGVVGRLIEDRGLKLGIIDTLTGGGLAQDLREAGFGHLIVPSVSPGNVDQALEDQGIQSLSDWPAKKTSTLARTLAEKAASGGGLGVVLLGPFGENRTFVSVRGPGGKEINEPGRNFQDTAYGRRWLAIQGLDWIRRVLLGRLKSPADWN